MQYSKVGTILDIMSKKLKIDYTTARLLHRAVKKSSVDPVEIAAGDLIVVTGAENDTVGIVESHQDCGDFVMCDLRTAAGMRTFKLSNNNYIHVIKKVSMPNLRNHTDYERDLQDMSKNRHGYEDGHAECPEHGPVTDSGKSALPTSKISLNLRTKAVADKNFVRYLMEMYYYNPKDAVQDMIKLLTGEMALETLQFAIREQQAQDESKYNGDNDFYLSE